LRDRGYRIGNDKDLQNLDRRSHTLGSWREHGQRGQPR
jgi:hypothetical protein